MYTSSAKSVSLERRGEGLVRGKGKVFVTLMTSQSAKLKPLEL